MVIFAGARALLKRKMNLDKQLQQILTYQERISFVKDQLEARSTQAEMLEGLRHATGAMKAVRGSLYEFLPLCNPEETVLALSMLPCISLFGLLKRVSFLLHLSAVARWC